VDNLKTYTIDIFSILLPGGLLLSVLSQFSSLECIFYKIFTSDEDWIKAVEYGGIAYALGHFIFFIGSFLDEWIFENVKRVFWNDHQLVAYVIALKEEKIGIRDRKTLNAFKWSCAWLLANKPEMYLGVERHIAESKFFRSLIVTLFALSVVYAISEEYWLCCILTVLMMLSFVRYLTQRQKSIETAYQFVITASGNVFPAEPDQTILERLTARNINPCKRPEGVNPVKFCTVRKMLVVVNLCLNPFYKRTK